MAVVSAVTERRKIFIGNQPHTVAGASPFSTDVPANLYSLVVNLSPKQIGAGTPSPTNVRTISGRSQTDILHSGSDTNNPDSLTVQYGSGAGTVYSGQLDIVKGVLTVDKVLLTKNTANMNTGLSSFPGWTNSGIKALIGSGYNGQYSTQHGFLMNVGTLLNLNTTSTNDDIYLPKSVYNKTESEWIELALDVQIIVPLLNPIPYSLTPANFKTLRGVNNIWCTDSGAQIAFKYWTH